MNVVRRLRSLSQLDQTFEPSPSGKHGSRPGSLTDWPSRRAWTHIKRYKLAAAPWGLPTLVAVPESDFHSPKPAVMGRSEEHTSELQSLMRISYAVFCLKKKNQTLSQQNITHVFE